MTKPHEIEVRSKISIGLVVEGQLYPAWYGVPPHQVIMLDVLGTEVPMNTNSVEIVRTLTAPAAPAAPAGNGGLTKMMSAQEVAAMATMRGLKGGSAVSTSGSDPLAGMFETVATAVEESVAEVGVPEPEEEVVQEEEVVVLASGKYFLSSFTRGELPASGVDHIIEVYAEDRFPEAVRADIPSIDKNYWWDPNVLEACHMAHQLNVKSLLVGPPGTGKTTAAMQYAAILRQPFLRLNGKMGIDASSFLGFLVPSSTGAEFKEGMLPMAMKNDYMMVIDEVMKIPAEIMMNFQTVFEEGGCLMLDEKPGLLNEKLVKPSSEFRLYTTDNVKGTGDDYDKFGSTQVHDGSFIDRIGITAEVGYLAKEVERELLKSMFPEVRSRTIRRFVNAANLVRDGYKNGDLPLTLSIRGLKVMCRLLHSGLSERAAYIMAYHTKLSDDKEVDASLSFIRTVKLKDEPYVLEVEEVDGDSGLAPVVPEDKKAAKMPWEI